MRCRRWNDNHMPSRRSLPVSCWQPLIAHPHRWHRVCMVLHGGGHTSWSNQLSATSPPHRGHCVSASNVVLSLLRCRLRPKQMAHHRHPSYTSPPTMSRASQPQWVQHSSGVGGIRGSRMPIIRSNGTCLPAASSRLTTRCLRSASGENHSSSSSSSMVAHTEFNVIADTTPPHLVLTVVDNIPRRVVVDAPVTVA